MSTSAAVDSKPAISSLKLATTAPCLESGNTISAELIVGSVVGAGAATRSDFSHLFRAAVESGLMRVKRTPARPEVSHQATTPAASIIDLASGNSKARNVF